MISEAVDYDYSYVRFLLVKSQNNAGDIKNIEYIASKNGCNRETYLEVENLQPGSYILLAEVEWENDFVRKLTNSTVRVNCYGPSQINFQQMNGVNRDQIVK